MRLTLDASARGKRLDRALADRLPDHSRTAIARWIRDGRVRVNGLPRPARHAVQGGEEVEVDLPPVRPFEVTPEPIPLVVLHADEEFLVLDKAAGLAVHPGSGRPGGTLANALAHRVGDLPALGGADRPGIVHRLDRETSGVIVVALSEFAQRALGRAFAERRVEKTYLALVHGVPAAAAGEVDAPIGRSPVHRTRMEVRPGGRRALTRWEVVETMARHALLRCHPHTGRTHQIRVHLKHLGHPIVGDRAYGRRDAPGEEHAPRLMLHALTLAFPHPRAGGRLEVTAPPPADLEACRAALGRLGGPRAGRR